MKKNVILSLIPACLLLASCNAPQEKAYDNELGNIIETTDAEDEEFLDAEIKYMDSNDTDSIPSIGLQSIDDEDKVNFRFIGAVKLTDKTNDGKVDDEDFEVGDVIWERSAYNSNGQENNNKPLLSFNATKVYTRVSAAGEVFDINTYNTQHGSDYTHFVTYVIRGVPSASNTAVLMANVRVKNGTKSNTLVSSFDKKTQFSFDTSVSENFIVKKKHDGSFETIVRNSINMPTYSDVMDRIEVQLNYSDESILYVDHQPVSSIKYFDIAKSIKNTEVQLSRDGESLFFKPTTIAQNGGNYVVEINASGDVNVHEGITCNASIRIENESNSLWSQMKEKLDDPTNYPNATVLLKVRIYDPDLEVEDRLTYFYETKKEVLEDPTIVYSTFFIIFEGSGSYHADLCFGVYNAKNLSQSYVESGYTAFDAGTNSIKTLTLNESGSSW